MVSAHLPDRTGCGERVFEWLLLGACSPDSSPSSETSPFKPKNVKPGIMYEIILNGECLVNCERKSWNHNTVGS